MLPVTRRIFCISQSADVGCVNDRVASLAGTDINMILGAPNRHVPLMTGRFETNNRFTGRLVPVLELGIPMYGGDDRDARVIYAYSQLITFPGKGFHRFTESDPRLQEDASSAAYENAFNWYGEQAWLKVLSLIHDNDRSSGVIETTNIVVIAHEMMLSLMAISASYTHTQNLKLGGRIWRNCDTFVISLRGHEVTEIEFLEPVSDT